MSGCRFCAIIKGQSPGTKIYEDDRIVVLMDIKPITKGHLLVLPKKHAELLTELDDSLAGDMLAIAKKAALALKKSKLGCRGINYFIADGAEAGQDVFHVHLHIIPRYRGDGFYLHMPPKYENETSLKELEGIAAKIRL